MDIDSDESPVLSPYLPITNSASELCPSSLWTILCASHDEDTSNCLKGHSIAPANRARLVDWMMHVMMTMECLPHALFLAVKIVDVFLKKCELLQNLDDLHSIGLVAMFLASKYVDRGPIRLEKLHRDISYSRVSPNALLLRERMMVQTLQSQVGYITVLDALEVLISTLGVGGVVARSSTVVAALALLEQELAAIPAAKLATVSVFIAVMVYSEAALHSVLAASGFSQNEIEAEVERVYSFLLELHENDSPNRSAMEEFQFEIICDESHPLFQFQDEELEQENRRLIESRNSM